MADKTFDITLRTTREGDAAPREEAEALKQVSEETANLTEETERLARAEEDRAQASQAAGQKTADAAGVAGEAVGRAAEEIAELGRNAESPELSKGLGGLAGALSLLASPAVLGAIATAGAAIGAYIKHLEDQKKAEEAAKQAHRDLMDELRGTADQGVDALERQAKAAEAYARAMDAAADAAERSAKAAEGQLKAADRVQEAQQKVELAAIDADPDATPEQKELRRIEVQRRYAGYRGENQTSLIEAQMGAESRKEEAARMAAADAQKRAGEAEGAYRQRVLEQEALNARKLQLDRDEQARKDLYDRLAVETRLEMDPAATAAEIRETEQRIRDGLPRKEVTRRLQEFQEGGGELGILSTDELEKSAKAARERADEAARAAAAQTLESAERKAALGRELETGRQEEAAREQERQIAEGEAKEAEARRRREAERDLALREQDEIAGDKSLPEEKRRAARDTAQSLREQATREQLERQGLSGEHIDREIGLLRRGYGRQRNDTAQEMAGPGLEEQEAAADARSIGERIAGGDGRFDPKKGFAGSPQIFGADRRAQEAARKLAGASGDADAVARAITETVAALERAASAVGGGGKYASEIAKLKAAQERLEQAAQNNRSP